MVYVLFNTLNWSIDDVLTQLAVILINVDYNREILQFNNGKVVKSADVKQLFFAEDRAGYYELFVKSINVYIFGIDIVNIRFVMNATIYNILASHGMLENHICRPMSQHVTEKKQRVVVFNQPIINYAFNIFIGYKFNIKEYVTKNENMIIAHNSYYMHPLVYSIPWPRNSFPFKLLFIEKQFINLPLWNTGNPFQIIRNVKEPYPWRVYDYNGNIDLAIIDEISPFAFDQAILEIIDKRMIVHPANTMNMTFGQFYHVTIKRTFKDIVDNIIEYMKPDDNELCKKTMLMLYDLWGRGVKVESKGKSFKIHNVIFSDDDSYIPTDNDIIIIS